MDRAVKIEVEIKDEKVVLRLRGELAQGEQSQVQDKVNDLLREGYKDFTVDWNDVSIDSAPFAPDVRWRLHAVGAFGIVVMIVIMFWRLAGIFGGL